tara:strand:+ start:75 stop:995 length:921 start_codon:yes stop_codon:yes gene_type:complete
LSLPKNVKEFICDYPALSLIGNTSMIKLDLPMYSDSNSLYVKCEHLNPGGSIKDRPVLRMLVEAILSGELTKDKVILDATSGNAGISYAMIGAILGYKVKLIMPENASEERKKRILNHGASIVFTDPILGYDETLREVKKIYDQSPENYFYCDQYSNINNPLAHYETTAEEIIKQNPSITHFIGGVGTGGTITGIGKKLKEYNPSIKICSINFDEWPGIEGLKPLGEGHMIPEIFDTKITDQEVFVDIDDAYKMCKTLANKGIFIGQSSGAYICGAQKISESLHNSSIVTIFNDLGERYFSTGIWD